jgi:acyl-CoA synthetase (AMP-forming)/AMP-acid ligase II
LLAATGDWAAPERAVFSGDTVRRDAEGFLYFVGRRDEMIKTSGYRVSPTEVEEVLYASGLVAEALVYAKPDEALGSAICAALWASPAASGQAAQDDAALMAHCRQHLPVFMLPRVLQWVDKPCRAAPMASSIANAGCRNMDRFDASAPIAGRRLPLTLLAERLGRRLFMPMTAP